MERSVTEGLGEGTVSFVWATSFGRACTCTCTCLFGEEEEEEEADAAAAWVDALFFWCLGDLEVSEEEEFEEKEEEWEEEEVNDATACVVTLVGVWWRVCEWDDEGTFSSSCDDEEDEEDEDEEEEEDERGEGDVREVSPNCAVAQFDVFSISNTIIQWKYRIVICR